MQGFVRSLSLSLILGLAACASPGPEDLVEPPSMDIAGLSLGRSSAFEDRAWLDLRLANHNDFTLGIERLDLDLVINERYFASGAVDHAITVPAGGEVVVPIVMTIGNEDPSVTVGELQGSRPLAYSLIGEADLVQTPDHTLEFEYNGEMEPSKLAGRRDPAGGVARPLADARP